ncbi:MAG: GNAT family N-acetyltransferase [Anaerolineae bacterium]
MTQIIRIASKEDTPQITHLLQHSVYSHWHVDWRLPGDWIGQKGFVLLSRNGKETMDSFRFHNPAAELLGCLVVTADPPPAAWVRVAGLLDVVRPFPALGAMMDEAVGNLQGSAVTEINWLATHSWPVSYLPMMGFEIANHIETYRKDGMAAPPIAPVSGLTFRAARAADMPLLAEIEEEGFAPRWRYSAGALRLAQQQAFSFDVALLGEEVVGYQLSTPTQAGVHLVRLVVRPSGHGRGIGSALLAHTLDGYQARGLNQVTLNTQIDNMPSQIVYQKFGFAATGEKFPVWTKQL